MKTTSISVKNIKHKWFIIDANDQTLGRLASNISHILRGKNLSNFSPHMDMGNYVVVLNADKVKLSGKKEDHKEYFRHSGYPGGMTMVKVKKLRQDFPERIILNAVKGMLPHNRLGRKLLSHLKVYIGENHPHGAQQPKSITFN